MPANPSLKRVYAPTSAFRESRPAALGRFRPHDSFCCNAKDKIPRKSAIGLLSANIGRLRPHLNLAPISHTSAVQSR